MGQAYKIYLPLQSSYIGDLEPIIDAVEVESVKAGQHPAKISVAYFIQAKSTTKE